jgi:hypothetical protein
MALPISLTTFAEKRARYVAELEYHQKRVDAAADAIAKLDAVIAMFDERDGLVEVRKLHREHTDGWRWGDIAKSVMRLLHAAPDGLTTTEAQFLIARDRGILDDPDNLRRLSKRVTAALSDKRRDGYLVQDGKRDGVIVFRIAQEGEGAVDPKRAEATRRRNAARALRRRQQHRTARKIS